MNKFRIKLSVFLAYCLGMFILLIFFRANLFQPGKDLFVLGIYLGFLLGWILAGFYRRNALFILKLSFSITLLGFFVFFIWKDISEIILRVALIGWVYGLIWRLIEERGYEGKKY